MWCFSIILSTYYFDTILSLKPIDLWVCPTIHFTYQYIYYSLSKLKSTNDNYWQCIWWFWWWETPSFIKDQTNNVWYWYHFMSTKKHVEKDRENSTLYHLSRWEWIVVHASFGWLFVSEAWDLQLISHREYVSLDTIKV